MKPKIDADAHSTDSGPDKLRITFSILNQTQLCSRWNLSPKKLQRWRSEGIGPPAWHISKSVRYPRMEVEAFERKARVTWKSSTGRALSEPSPTAREDAIQQMMQQRPGRRDQIFYSGKEMVAITGPPTSWLQQYQERQWLRIPFYSLANGDVIRFSIEKSSAGRCITCVLAAAVRPCPSMHFSAPARSPCCARRRATSSARPAPATA